MKTKTQNLMDELLDKTSFQMLNPAQLGEMTKMRNKRRNIKIY